MTDVSVIPPPAPQRPVSGYQAGGGGEVPEAPSPGEPESCRSRRKGREGGNKPTAGRRLRVASFEPDWVDVLGAEEVEVVDEAPMPMAGAPTPSSPPPTAHPRQSSTSATKLKRFPHPPSPPPPAQRPAMSPLLLAAPSQTSTGRPQLPRLPRREEDQTGPRWSAVFCHEMVPDEKSYRLRHAKMM